jgi:acetyl-CoA carboxylase carboxyltransferase component
MADEKASWRAEIEELRRQEVLARQMGGEERIARHKANGKLTVRERIAALLDPNSFHETGALSGKPKYDTHGRLVDLQPANFVCGRGLIDNRKIIVAADDFTVRGGASDAAIVGKQAYAERMARDFRLPLVRLVDGTGGGGSVKSLEDFGYTYVPVNPGWDLVVENLGLVPVISACLGSVAGLGAARVCASHFSVMVEGISQLFVAGPAIVKYGIGEDLDKEQLGGVDVHRASGAIDNIASSEADAFAQIRRFLSYMPANVWELPPVVETSDASNRREEDLLKVIPHKRSRVYKIRDILPMIFDKDSLFEMGRYYGASLVTLFARLNGHPVGVIAPDPLQVGGALTDTAADKMIRFIDMCQTFHLPIVNLVDQPGIAVGIEAERRGTIRKTTRAISAVYQLKVPIVEVILRRVFGVGGAGMINGHGLHWRYAWPSADWGSLPFEGGIQVAYRREIEASPDPVLRQKELLEKLESVRSPFRTAHAFGIEEIIDPRDTRPLLCEWVIDAYRLLPEQFGPSLHFMRP